MTDFTYVRSEMTPAQPAPVRTSGALAWVRTNLFASLSDAILTLLAVAFLLWALPPLLRFVLPNFGLPAFDFPIFDWLPDWLRSFVAYFDLTGRAVPLGGTVEDCRVTNVGACWAYIGSEIEFFIYGFYPMAEYWRPNLVFALLVLLGAPLLYPRAPYKVLNAALFFIALPIVSGMLLSGGLFGLPFVPTERWGGLLVTLIISLVGICCSLPLGILLALGRQSKLPVIKSLSIAFIELIRAVPLITILFMASIMLPLFMPQGTTVDKLVRALVGVTLFSSAYMAEVVRGGMQAIGRGQYEAAMALGLGYWRRTGFVILPQALKHVIPGIVGSFISLLKDTSLVYIVGMKDLLEAVRTKNDAIEWASPTQSVTGYLFAAAVFWIMCFSISRYSRYWENRLNTGHKR